MSVGETVVLWCLVLVSGAAFAAQTWARLRLLLVASNTFSLEGLGVRVGRLVFDVAGQRRTIAERPAAGLAHAFVFWGFLAFGGYTAVEFLRGLGIADLTPARWFHVYRVLLTPFAVAVLLGIVFLLIRRACVRPAALGASVSAESIVIGLFITTLMVTFLLTWQIDERSRGGHINWWLHSQVILAFLALIPASKHFHVLLAPITVFLRSPELGNVSNLDFEQGQVGLETIADLGSKTVLDAFTCVECGRCQVNCPAWQAGKALNPKAIILQTREALLAGEPARALAEVYSQEVLWQCTTCGACENQCPVGVEHVPLLVGARRGLVSNGDAPAYLGAIYNHLERRSNIWGLSYEQRQRFVDSSALEIFDPAKHDVLVWLGCAGAFEAGFQNSIRALCEILRAKHVRFGVLSKERCTGDAAKRTGNEYLYQELANANIADLKAAAPKKIITSCPHCVKTIGSDYRKLGYTVEILHSSVFVEELTRSDAFAAGRGVGHGTDGAPVVTYHDPCYLGRYSRTTDEPRDLMKRFGAELKEPERNRENPYCCGAGGGLLFADKEEVPGSRISDIRFTQLQDTGAQTVVTACPFCSIMLKGAQASAPRNDVQFVDIMTFVNGQLKARTPA